jgi:plasmid segregation protein ParM
MEIQGIDIGFGFTKGTNGKAFTIFKSILGEATDIQFRMGIGAGSPGRNLHVSLNGQSYFIGEFAEMQSNVRQFTLDQEKLVTDFVKTLGLTAMGVLAEDNAPTHIVSGLPVGYYKAYSSKISKLLSGRHDITFHQPDGNTESRKLDISKIKMIPQPLGSIFNLLMDDKGRIVNKELTKQKVGVVDIGFRTTDFSIFDQLRYVERGSATTDTGISKCFSVIAKKLRSECGVNVELYRLFSAMETGFIKIRGKEYAIASLRDQVFAHTATSIFNDVERLWADDWDMDTILLTGGGSMELARFLEPMIVGNVIPVQTQVDARLNNVQGYYKYGCYTWGASASPPQQAQPEESEA